jgi:hypothetical protein
VADKPSAYVLDSFAVLAYLGGEIGMPRVRELLERAELALPILFSLQRSERRLARGERFCEPLD